MQLNSYDFDDFIFQIFIIIIFYSLKMNACRILLRSKTQLKINNYPRWPIHKFYSIDASKPFKGLDGFSPCTVTK